jgi:Mlc titration factor MtfA (ptsG expression regulator)
MWKSLRRQRLRNSPLSASWRQMMERHCPFYCWMPAEDRRELEGHSRIFLAEKNFEGCGGLILTDEIKVSIASQACVLLLHRRTDYYPHLKSVLVYPGDYASSETRPVGINVVEVRPVVRAGESWREGVVVLSWDSVQAGSRQPELGHNVVLHEFAHQLDYEDGQADGVPLLGHGEPRNVRAQRYADWQRIMRQEFETLRAQAISGQSSFLRHYGATNAAEFFAVATENFFCRPGEMRQWHPEIYEQMKWYYQQDPAMWSGLPISESKNCRP